MPIHRQIAPVSLSKTDRSPRSGLSNGFHLLKLNHVQRRTLNASAVTGLHGWPQVRGDLQSDNWGGICGGQVSRSQRWSKKQVTTGKVIELCEVYGGVSRLQYETFSSGEGKKHCHPKEEVLERVAKTGASLLRKDELGTIEVMPMACRYAGRQVAEMVGLVTGRTRPSLPAKSQKGRVASR